MEINLLLLEEIGLKQEKFDKEIELLSKLPNYIKNKQEFSKVWYTLLKCDIGNTDLARKLVSYYFDLPLDNIVVTPGRIIIKYDKGCSFELYWGNMVSTPNIVHKNISSTFFVEARLPFVWNNLIEEKKPFKKGEIYQIAEEFVRLIEEKAPLSEILDFRYEGVSKPRQYYLYFTKDRKKDRDISYYKGIIEKEHKNYQDYCDKWDKDTANALNEFLDFYAEIYPMIQKNFSSEYSRVKYNVEIDKIIEKLKGMGEIL